MKGIDGTSLGVAGMAVAAATLPAMVLACSYDSSTFNYNRCNGMYCTGNYQCQTNYCDYGYYTCETQVLPPWAISMIVFFCIFVLITVCKVIARRK